MNELRWFLKRVIDYVWAIFHPTSWIRVHEYSSFWDKELCRLMENQNFVRINTFNAKIGNISVWTRNYPYGSFSVEDGPFGMLTNTLPARRTVNIAMKKMIEDTKNS